MDYAGPPAVEFLDAVPTAGSDEVLAGAPPRGLRHRVIVLLGALLAVAAGAVVARAAGGSGSAPPASAAATPGRVMPSPAVSNAPMAAPSVLPIPVGCQTAGCVVVSGIPPSLERAVHAVFPRAVLREAYSVRSDDLRSLRSRNVRGELGGEEFVLDVGAAPAVPRLSVHGRRDGRGLQAVARISHYRITITAADDRVALDRLLRLARDPALIALR